MMAEEYTAALRRIEQGNPKEVLLPLLRKGHSRANEIYLRSALKRVAEPAMGEPDAPEEPEKHPVDDVLRGLWKERTRLFGEMNKQSNLFHTCKNDAERAANSAKVLSWWDDIQAVKAKIAHYEQYGSLPTLGDGGDGDELPDNPALLSKKLNSLRARISQVKKKITDIAGLDEGTPGKQSKINSAEDDLKRLRYLEGKAAVKLKEYEQTA